MPNHIKNIVRVTGPNATEVFKSVRSEADEEGNENLFDFNRIIKMPEILVDTTSGSKTHEINRIIKSGVDAKKSNEVIKQEIIELMLSNERAQPDADVDLLIDAYKEHGSLDWYDWSIKNWGTKWNSYSHYEIDDKCLCFETAWSTPVKVIEVLSKKFPKNKITVRYADEDIGSNCGRYVFKAGDMIEDYTPEPNNASSYANRI